jgi:hypothetical protein
MIGNRMFAIAAASAALAAVGATAVSATTEKSQDRLTAIQSGNDKPAAQPNTFTVTSMDLYGIDKFSVFAPAQFQELLQSANPARQRDEFLGFDRNGDGHITVSEWIEPMRMPETESANGNETVSLQSNRLERPNPTAEPPKL